VTDQREVDDRHDSLVVEGDDEEHVLPPTELDPFTPEPEPPGRKARVALALALLVIVLVLIAVGVYAATR
jgi:hypothetical protein